MANNLEHKQLHDIMGQSYIDYSMSVITDRALPDVRDGLKPVQRRILWAMENLKAYPGTPYRKVARIVGDTIGKYHPHSDASIEGAVVYLAQWFNNGSVLIEGNGNFGSQDGDGAAASRYCVTGDTRIPTNIGMLKIKDIINSELDTDNDIDISVKSLNSQNQHASKLFNSGRHPIFEVALVNGQSIKATSNHPLLTMNKNFELEWKTIDQLKVGDKCVVDLDTNNALFGPNDDLLEAKMLGAMVSEGCATTQNRLTINNSDIQMILPVKEFFERETKTQANICQDSNGIYNYCIADKNYYDKFVKTYQMAHAVDKVIPEVVFCGTREYQALFLKYLFEGDGSVSFNNSPYVKSNIESVSYSTYSKQLANDVQILLLNFGIFSTIEYHVSKSEYKVCIARSSFIKFKNSIGFVSLTKNNKLNALCKSIDNREIANNNWGFCNEMADFLTKTNEKIKRRITTLNRLLKYKDYLCEDSFNYAYGLISKYVFLPVKSITALGEDIVYSIKVDSDCHSFSGNGFINHNTEARLSKIAMEMVRDINLDTVDMVDNFDNMEKEPVILPARIPNLLINGTQGIAVGMTSNIPPHNVGETIDGCVAMLDAQIKNKDIDNEDLIKIIDGPDFPTGAVILGNSYKDVYRTGKGKIEMECTYHIEPNGKSKENIVIDSIPFRVVKRTLVEAIADRVKEAKLDVTDVRDETSREGMRIVIELKKGAIADIIINDLKKHTQLRSNFNANMLCLVNKRPKCLNLHDMIMYYLQHQEEIVTRRTNYNLKKATARAHIIDALLLAIDNIDEIIATIKGSADTESAKLALMSKFGFDDIQAQYIVDMRLKALAGLETQKLKDELANLKKDIAFYNKILGDRKELLKLIKKELLEIKKKHATPRLTTHVMDYSDITMEDIIADDPVVIIRSAMGYIKRLSPEQFNAQKKGGKGSKGITTIENDRVADVISTTAHSSIIFFTTAGKAYAIKAYQIPENGKNARGTAIISLLKIPSDEKITNVIDSKRDIGSNKYLLMITKMGIVKKISFEKLPVIRSNGLIMATLKEGDALVSATIVSENDDVMIITKEGQCLCYSSNTVRAMGRQAMGVRGIKLMEGDEVVSVQPQINGKEILLVTEKSYAKRIACSEFKTFKNKNGKGMRAIKAAKLNETGKIVSVVMVNDVEDDLLLITDGGQVIRTPINKIPVLSRPARGTRTMKLEDTAVIADLTTVIANAMEDVSDDE